MIKISDNHTITVQKAVKKLEFILIETEYATTVQVIIAYKDDTFDSSVISLL